jgi:CheY-like chemotaxis protein
VIEQNDNHREAVGDLLTRLGAQVRTADSAGQGLKLLANEKFDFVFFDPRLPDAGDGYLLGESIAKQHAAARVVVMLTTDKLTQSARCRELGLGSILKPVRQADLARLLKVEGAGSAEEGAESGPAIRALRVLLVDDSMDNRILIRGYLRDTGSTIEEAENGAVALEKFKASVYDVVLTDTEMPVMDGYTATREMRRVEKERGKAPTPILALTAHALAEARERSFEAGCSGHLTKPIPKAALLEALREHTGASILRERQPAAAVAAATADDQDWLKALVPGYVSRCRADVDALFPALERGDYAAIRTTGHQLSGSGASYGFPRLTELGASLEQAAMARDAGLARNISEKLREFLSQAG